MKEWTTVKITPATRKRLDDLLKVQIERQENNQIDLPVSGSPGKFAPSLDWLINVLLDRWDAHRDRSKRQRARKRGIPSDDELAGEVAHVEGDGPGADDELLAVQLGKVDPTDEDDEDDEDDEISRSDLIDVVPDCPQCHAVELAALSRRATGDGKRYQTWHCQKCDHVFELPY